MRSIQPLRQKRRSQAVKSQWQSPPKENLEKLSVGLRRSREAEVLYSIAFLSVWTAFLRVSPSLTQVITLKQVGRPRGQRRPQKRILSMK